MSIETLELVRSQSLTTAVRRELERRILAGEILPGANYEAGRSQLSLRVPDDPSERFPAVVRAADALLSVRVAA